MNPEKQALRREAKKIRAQLDMPGLSRAICRQLAEWPVFRQARHVLFFAATGIEPDLQPLAKRFSEKCWYLPRVLPNREMVFHLVAAGDSLVPGPMGILQPQEASPVLDAASEGVLVLLPCLMLSRAGVRLGFGGGYYDRFMEKNLVRQWETACVVPEALFVDALPADSWDTPVRWGVTETGCYRLPHA